MRIEVIKMTLQKRENSNQKFVYELERPLEIYGSNERRFLLIDRLFLPVISFERVKCKSDFSEGILENILQHLTDRQIKQSCLTLNKQWRQCALKGSLLAIAHHLCSPPLPLSFLSVLESRSSIGQLPNELLLRLFKYYLTPLDLLQSSIRVNRLWKSLVHDSTIWKTVNPINWARGRLSSSIVLPTHRSMFRSMEQQSPCRTNEHRR